MCVKKKKFNLGASTNGCGTLGCGKTWCAIQQVAATRARVRLQLGEITTGCGYTVGAAKKIFLVSLRGLCENVSNILILALEAVVPSVKYNCD
jgi:hypothetical protein